MNLLAEFRARPPPPAVCAHQPGTPMSAEPILCRIEDGVAVVTLNNPPLNVVTLELTRRLEATLDRLAADPAARVLVLTGAGERAFCAGSDIKEFPELSASGPGDRAQDERRRTRPTSRSTTSPKPTIAAVTGLAFGGGLDSRCAATCLVVEEHARLALPEIKLGVFPGSGGTVRVTRRVGEGRAKEMMFFGDPLDARDRARLGPRQPRGAAGRSADTPPAAWRAELEGAAPTRRLQILQARDRPVVRHERGRSDRRRCRSQRARCLRPATTARRACAPSSPRSSRASPTPDRGPRSGSSCQPVGSRLRGRVS